MNRFWGLKIVEAALLGAVIAAIPSSLVAQEIRSLDEAQQHFRRGLTLKQQSRLAQSEAEFRASIQLDPQVPEAYNNLGAVLRLERRTDEAISDFERALQLQPSFTGARYNLALAFGANRQFSRAEREMRTVIEGDDSCGRCWYELGILADRQNKPQQAIERLNQAIAIDQNSSDSYYALAHELLAVNQREESEKALRRAIALRPDFAAAHQELGLSLERQQRFEDALKEFRSAAALNPRLTQALLGQARMKAALGDAVAARTIFTRCIASDPKDASARVLFAAFLRQRGQAKDAIGEAQRASVLKPDLASAYYEMGMALKEVGDRGGAENALRRALRIDSSDEQSHIALVALLRAEGKTGAAGTELAAVRSILKRQSDRDEAALANKLGVGFASQQKWSEAIAQFQKALDLKPDLVAARFNLAGALRESGDLQGAISEFNRILQEHPDWTEARFQLGRTLEVRGLQKEAREQYRRIVNEDPDFAPAQQALSAMGASSLSVRAVTP